MSNLTKRTASSGIRNILLVVPPNITFDDFRNPRSNTKSWIHKSGAELGVAITDVPLGAMSLSSFLKDNWSCNVNLIDFNVLLNSSWDHRADNSFSEWFRDELKKVAQKPDLIGFSSLFVTGYLNLLELGKICRELFQDSLMVVGGNVATTMGKEIFSDDCGVFDALCHGEGEIPIQQLMDAAIPEGYIAESTSWITREKLASDSFSPEHRFIENLDEIPNLDYDVLTLEDYHHSPTIKAYTQISDKENYITYMTSRGCPFLCTFCAAHTVHGRKMRYFSLERIEKELKELVARFSPKTLVLEDDHFLSDRTRALSILEIVRNLGMVCVFPNALALYALDKEMLEALSTTGVKQLTLAVESGSKRVLKNLMRKPLRTDITQRVANDCWELGIYTDCNIIIGMPGETDNDLAEAREFLQTLRVNWYRINVATPLAGSDMYISAKEKGQIVGDIREAGYKRCVVQTEHFDPESINRHAYEMNLYLNFVHNQDMKEKNFDRAAESFENVLRLKSDHAYAKRFLGEALIHMGDQARGTALRAEGFELMKTRSPWNEYAAQHDLI